LSIFSILADFAARGQIGKGIPYRSGYNQRSRGLTLCLPRKDARTIIFELEVRSVERPSYTAFGDVVNVASRLETLGKEFNAEILISEETRRLAGPKTITRSHGPASIKGGIETFMVLGS
jgi:Adenylate and Guanylate cyclase catalytic domain